MSLFQDNKRLPGCLVPVEFLKPAKKMARRGQGLAALFKSSWLCIWIVSFTAVSVVYGFDVLDVDDTLGPARLLPSVTSSHTSLIQNVDNNLSPDVPFARARTSESGIPSAPTEIYLSSIHVLKANATEGIAREQDQKRTGRSLLEGDSGKNTGTSTSRKSDEANMSATLFPQLESITTLVPTKCDQTMFSLPSCVSASTICDSRKVP